MLDVAALQQENVALRAQVTLLIESIAKLNERVSELLAVAQRKQRKPSPPKPPVLTSRRTARTPREIPRNEVGTGATPQPWHH